MKQKKLTLTPLSPEEMKAERITWSWEKLVR